MKLRIIHQTVYRYGDPVSTSHHEAHLAPRDCEQQRTLSHDVSISPSPSVRRERFDFFGNRTLHFSLREPHRALELTATSVVDRRSPPTLVDLTPSTVAAISGGERFRNVEETPAQAISMGMASILEATRVLLIATGVGKAEALYRMVTGRVGPGMPASLLTGHHNLTIVADHDACAKLPPETLAELA